MKNTAVKLARPWLIAACCYCLSAISMATPQTGNFLLGTFAQPGPLIGIGEQIIDADKLVTFFFADQYKGTGAQYVDLAPSILYGITNRLSIFLEMPYAAYYQNFNQHTSGLEDAVAQLEYAYYLENSSAYQDQSTVLFNVTLPTGNSNGTPPTGMNAVSYLFGTTFNRTYTDWFFFLSPDVLLTTTRNQTKFGNQYFYQGGIGRNIADLYSQWILAWMIEVNGQYLAQNKINGAINNSSGGNVIYVTPSLWLSSKNFVFQFGLGEPLTQHWYGTQPKYSYLAAINLGFQF